MERKVGSVENLARVIMVDEIIDGVWVLKSVYNYDSRGHFARLIDMDTIEKVLPCFKEIKQVNHSLNRTKGTVRGMHFSAQLNEAKILKCLRGSLFDVFVDTRNLTQKLVKKESLTLRSDDQSIVLIAPWIAHGFQTLEDNTELLYFHNIRYEETIQNGINPLDLTLKIDWPLPITQISDKDRSWNLI